MKLVFTSIKNGTIFETDFQNLTPANGTVQFKRMNAPGGLAVVYAPNGTGKSSLTRVLAAEQSDNQISFSATDDNGVTINPETMAFHIIPDQVNRNVIGGKETDYLIGHQIRREYELRDNINSTMDAVYNSLKSLYKSEFNVSKVGDYLLTQISARGDDYYQKAYKIIRTIVNKKSCSTDVDVNEFAAFIRGGYRCPATEMEEEKRKFVITDVGRRSSAIKCISNLIYDSISANEDAVEIEKYDDAIGVLEKYHLSECCVVCDNPEFNGDSLLARKRAHRKRVYDSLDAETKGLLDNVVTDGFLQNDDPFQIKKTAKEFLAGGDTSGLCDLQRNLNSYICAIEDEMIRELFNSLDGTFFLQNLDEYNLLSTSEAQLDNEELMFIEDVVSESIGKDIRIERDPDSKNYKLKLGNKDLLNTERTSMELSTGEQNFVSLAFELLMARNSTKEYVILDDPISSFDSVYKNKIAFCIVKFLEKKKQLVLTHNTDLIRLLDVQLNNCFNLYILNNVENGQNGFIPVSEKEKKILINMYELVKLFQNKDGSLMSAIRDRRQFLMSMIPFMRGYAHISLDNNDYYGKLSDIMHGYCTGSVNIVPIYKELFGYDFGSDEVISVADILSSDCSQLNILDKSQFPLLADTLEKTFAFYHLRMKVEKELVDAFTISTQDMDTLNKIIRKAFDCPKSDPDYIDKRNYRVYFTSRKTLLNEFNHFEGNMNIFQPAIDIHTAALQKEIEGINSKLAEVKRFAACRALTAGAAV